MKPFETILIGCSAGGVAALHELLSSLPGTFSLPIIIVQHMGAEGKYYE